MERIEIRVAELDCAEEARILREALGKIQGVERVSFDLIAGKMILLFDERIVDPKTLLEGVRSCGMRGEFTEKGEGIPIRGLKTGEILCGVSGFFLLLGMLFHFFFEQTSAELLSFGIGIVSGGWFVFPRALSSLLRKSPDMHLLMTVAVIGAIAIGQWLEGASVTFLFSLALLLESWSVARARKAIQALLDLQPKIASVLLDGKRIEMEVEEIAVGMRVLIKPFERIPLDGKVEEGSTHVDQSPITGESMPVLKKRGDPLFAGTINGEAAIEMVVEKGLSDTTLSHILTEVKEARTKRAASEQWVDSFAKIYTPFMMGLALLVALFPPIALGGIWAEWIYRGLVLLVIACPCALVISTPVTIVSALAAAAREGILIKGGVFLEIAGKVKGIGFDKTGTLTEGKPAVSAVVPMNGHTSHELIEIAASLEIQSKHPLSKAICKRAEELGLALEAASDYRSFQGLGAEGTTQKGRFWIGSHRFMHEAKRKETPEAHAAAVALEDSGHSVVAIGDFSHICGLITLTDRPRKEAASLIRELRALGIEQISLLTGDNKKTADALAKEIGITSLFSELMPRDKVEVIELLKREVGLVAMVGDGVNDAPALAASSLGIALGGIGSNVAFETADIVLMEDNISKIPWLICHSRRALSVIHQNISFSLGVKTLFVVLALFDLSSLWMAIAADTGASLLVVMNGLRLLKASHARSR